MGTLGRLEIEFTNLKEFKEAMEEVMEAIKEFRRRLDELEKQMER
jgi:Sec-independent protein translocase protein TatA